MNAQERRATAGLSAIVGLRLFGLFVILPVFALYAETLPGGLDHTLVGVALGAYGLTQAVLQIPFGWLSDRWGRKPAIYLGLLLFAAGSFVAASATSIGWVIAGRVLQGSGAVSAAVTALTADLTRDSVRTRAMAFIGVSVGLTFALSMVAGPLLDAWVGVPGIFALTGVLALSAILLVRFGIPDPTPAASTEPAPPFRSVLRDAQLLRLNFGVFTLHAVLMAMFAVVPFELREAGLAVDRHWLVYLPVMLGSFVLMVPGIVVSERGQRQKEAFVASVAVLAISFVLLAWAGPRVIGLAAALLVFFTAFNILEAILPSLISRIAPARSKGAAIGVYASTQFLGAFCGAVAGGWLSQRVGGVAVLWFCALMALAWLALAGKVSVPQVRRYEVPQLDAEAAAGLSMRLRALPGVRDAAVSPGSGAAVLKVDNRGFDEQNVIRLLEGERPWGPSTRSS
jgi:MFS family permease